MHELKYTNEVSRVLKKKKIKSLVRARIKKIFFKFIWLFWVLVAARGIFSCSMQTLICNT